MKDLLLPENSEVLAQLAWSKVLLAFDFDGTLAPIVSDRAAAEMRERTAALFQSLCDLYPCAVISGRSHADVGARLGKAWVKYVVGNHGLEPGALLEEFEEDTKRVRQLLELQLASLRGVELEDKRYSLAVHYRGARQKRETRQAILGAIGGLPVPARAIWGKLVVNVVPARAPNKGDALIELRNAEEADTAFYIGDDVTDEDVFILDQPGRLLTVRVGESRGSSAAYFVRGQRDIDRLLTRLISLRKANTAARDRRRIEDG
jgi:trehalose 6-phosphate phosphatase